MESTVPPLPFLWVSAFQAWPPCTRLGFARPPLNNSDSALAARHGGKHSAVTATVNERREFRTTTCYPARIVFLSRFFLFEMFSLVFLSTGHIRSPR